MAEKYRPRTRPYGSGSAPVTGVRLAPKTLEGIAKIKTLFQRRYPMEHFPTLSACLDHALRRYLEEFGNDPKALRAEVALFKERYERRTVAPEKEPQ